MKSGSSSAVAKWVIAPASSRSPRAATASATVVASTASRVPRRPMPVSYLTCTRRPPGSPATQASRQATTSASAATASASSSRESAPITTRRTSGSASRSAIASPAVATNSQLAPPVSAARAAGSAPCPYPSALTTTPSCAGGTSAAARRAQLRSIAATSIRASARSAIRPRP